MTVALELALPPDAARLAAVKAELRGLPPGAQRALGGGVYLRLDGSGRGRFFHRLRVPGRGQPQITFDSWEGARDSRLELELRIKLGGGLEVMSIAEIRFQPLERYSRGQWWARVLNDCDANTVRWYRDAVEDICRYLGRHSPKVLELVPDLIEQMKTGLRAEKTYQGPRDTKPRFHRPAVDKPLKVLRTICNELERKGVVERQNPMAGIKFFDRRRGAGGKPAKILKVRRRDLKHPRTLALAAAGIRAYDPLILLERRAVVELIFTGMRPSDIWAMRNGWWRHENGPLPETAIVSAVKDLDDGSEGRAEDGGPRPLPLPVERSCDRRGHPRRRVRLLALSWPGILAHPRW